VLGKVPHELMAITTQIDLTDSATLRIEQTSSSLGIERRIVPRRRFQQGRVYRRGKKWVGSYREHELNPKTGQRVRRTITFPDSITSERAARRELEPYLNVVNVAVPAPAKRTGKTLSELVDEWKEKIIPNLKDGTVRAALSHIRTYIIPVLGEVSLAELSLAKHQTFITAVGRRVDRRKTAENVYGTFTAVLSRGRQWNYLIPEVSRKHIAFPVDKKTARIFFFDPDLAARVISAADQPFKTMFLLCAVLGLRVGEITALKITSLDFRRKTIDITAALDYATRKEITPKSDRSAAPLPMSPTLEKHLRNWIEKEYRPNAATNPEGYLFTNSKGRPYLSDNVVRYGVHRAMDRLGIKTPKGIHVGVHCFRHGVTTSLLESGTPIHIVTKLMRHSDSRVTLNHYAHVVSDVDRKASEKLSLKIEQNIAQLESDSELESGGARTA
jgi:integrase